MKVTIIDWPESQACKECCHSTISQDHGLAALYLCQWSITDEGDPIPTTCPLGIPLSSKSQKEVHDEYCLSDQ